MSYGGPKCVCGQDKVVCVECIEEAWHRMRAVLDYSGEAGAEPFADALDRLADELGAQGDRWLGRWEAYLRMKAAEIRMALGV